MMIDPEAAYYLKEHDELAREVEEYKRINANLKKKIHARDKKITYLFSCIDQMTKSSVHTGENLSHSLHKNQSSAEHMPASKFDINYTDPKKRQKENVSSNQQNLFKERESQFNYRIRDNLKLPALQKKGGLGEEGSEELMSSKPRIIKVSIEKLVPLRAQEVKKKFQSKYK